MDQVFRISTQNRKIEYISTIRRHQFLVKFFRLLVSLFYMLFVYTFPFRDIANFVDDFRQSFSQTSAWVLINRSQPNVTFHTETKLFVLQGKSTDWFLSETQHWAEMVNYLELSLVKHPKFGEGFFKWKPCSLMWKTKLMKLLWIFKVIRVKGRGISRNLSNI